VFESGLTPTAWAMRRTMPPRPAAFTRR
jgi:hypothetical protein